MIDLRTQYADRLKQLWMSMYDAMSQGGQHSICVDPEMAEDIRAAEVLARRDWRPIETAPKDGTEILGRSGNFIRVGILKRFQPGVYEYFRDDVHAPGHTWSFEPTHWMPLPSPPASDSDDRVTDGDGGAGASHLQNYSGLHREEPVAGDLHQ